jgi:hypothetical protein
MLIHFPRDAQTPRLPLTLHHSGQLWTDHPYTHTLLVPCESSSRYPALGALPPLVSRCPCWDGKSYMICTHKGSSVTPLWAIGMPETWEGKWFSQTHKATSGFVEVKILILITGLRFTDFPGSQEKLVINWWSFEASTHMCKSIW